MNGTLTNLALLLIFMLQATANAEDIVVVQKSKDSPVSKRRGEIIDWKGGFLEIESGGRTRSVPNEEIVDVITAWPEAFNNAKKLLNGREYQRALEQLATALSEEPRPWAKRIIRAKILECYDALGTNQMDQVRQFLAIANEDLDSRFINQIPLPWTGTMGGADVAKQTERLLESRNLAAQLIAASWALSGNRRGDALKKLEDLSLDINPRLAAIAQAQLWKAQVKATDAELKTWQAQIKDMPKTVRGGAYFVLGQALSRNKQYKSAQLAYMRVPILHSQQHSLVAASLYQAGDLLQNDGNDSGAKTLWRELVQKYPQSFWAQQAASRLQAASARK